MTYAFQTLRCRSEWAEKYVPTAVEECLAQELGLWWHDVMVAAVQNPRLVRPDCESQVGGPGFIYYVFVLKVIAVEANLT